MLTIHLTDPDLIRAIEARAKQHNLTIEQLLRQTFVEPTAPPPASDDEADALYKRAMRKIYDMARRYWRSVGDVERANLTDEQLAVQFGRFDEHGIPRLKHELTDDPPVGSLAYAAKIIEETGGVVISKPLNEPLDLTNLKDVLAQEFGDYLYKRMTGNDDG